MKEIILWLIIAVSGQSDVAFEDVFDHECGATSMSTRIKASDLAALGSWGEDFSLITLNEGCSGVLDEERNEIVFDAGSLKELPLECGTQYGDDGNGRISFWNVVQYTPPNDSPITRDASGLYNFSCIYDMSVDGQKFELSLSHKVTSSPIDSIWFEGRTAEGKFRATMELYRDEAFENSYEGYSVTLSLEQRLYIDVTLDAADPDVALKVIKCWATPTIEADDNVRHTLIHESCPTDTTVKFHDSDNRNSARWESQMFQFVDEPEVWLHCDIQACDSRKYECETTCENRKRREISEMFGGRGGEASRSARSVSPADKEKSHVYTANILTVGPVRNKERFNEPIMGQDTAAIIATSVVGALIIIALIVGIVYVCKFRNSTGNGKSQPRSEVTNDWQLYGAPPAEQTKSPLQQW